MYSLCMLAYFTISQPVMFHTEEKRSQVEVVFRVETKEEQRTNKFTKTIT